MTTDAGRKRRFRLWTDGYHALARLQQVVEGCGLEPSLLELVKLRASQLNGCAYCVDRHAVDARAGGEADRRIDGLVVWREAPYYDERERAALALTEAVTRLAGGVPDDVIAEAAAHFSPDELGRLLFAIIEINAWNRLAVTTGAPEPGSYRRTGP